MSLDSFLTHLLRVSAAVAGRDPVRLRRAMESALAHSGAGEEEWVQMEEALVQSYLFVGYPGALNSLGLWREVSARLAGSGLTEDPARWRGRGEAVCREVYGSRYEGLRRNIAALHSDLDRWMVEEGYGKVLGRPGLDLRVRELCIVAILAVQGAPVQLYSHLRGSLRTGASESEVEMALRAAAGVAGGAGAHEAQRVWDHVRATRKGETD